MTVAEVLGEDNAGAYDSSLTYTRGAVPDGLLTALGALLALGTWWRRRTSRAE